MTTKVSIIGAEFHALHGYYEEERLAGHTFIVDVEVTLQSFDSQDDNIDDTINYESIYSIIKAEMEKTQKLIETVALNIINRCKIELPNIKGANVKIEKLAPQLGGKVAKSVIQLSF
jgi:dihydroneopterin aldolase